MSNAVWTVSQLLGTVKQTIESNVNFKQILIKGEISNFTAHQSGHWYFSIKDDKSKINCIMFSSYNQSVSFTPKEGSKILINASVSVYPVQGQLQLTVFSMQLDGIGDLYLQFEKLKQQLFNEGLFNDLHKKPIPTYPESIGIISGSESAALIDILKTLNLRWPNGNISVYESMVQGSSAPSNIISKLKEADLMHHDVLILARGGGSIEDLWAFNDEQVARTIYGLNTPIVTGIGHEIDITIADYVADYRAATPTAAAQKVVRDYKEVQIELNQQKQLLVKAIQQKYQLILNRYTNLKEYAVWRNPDLLWHDQAINLTMHTQKLLAFTHQIKPLEERLRYNQDLLKQHANMLLKTKQQSLMITQTNLPQAINHRINLSRKDYGAMLGLLDAYSPLGILKRGYTLVQSKGIYIKTAKQLEPNEEIKISFYDGSLNAVIKDKEN